MAKEAEKSGYKIAALRVRKVLTMCVTGQLQHEQVAHTRGRWHPRLPKASASRRLPKHLEDTGTLTLIFCIIKATLEDPVKTLPQSSEEPEEANILEEFCDKSLKIKKQKTAATGLENVSDGSVTGCCIGRSHVMKSHQ